MSNVVKQNDRIEEVKQLRRDIETAFIFLGQRLEEIHKDREWEGRYDSFEDFLLDIDLSPGQASKLRNIYTRFVLELGFQASEIAHIGQRRLYAILPTCVDKNTAERNFASIKGLTTSDVEKKVKADVAGEHDHNWIQYRMCSVCKETHRLYED